MSALDVQSLRVEYDGRHGKVTALSEFSVLVPEGHLLVLLGESGCGKSTALNAIAGLIEPHAGRIQLGEDVLLSGPPGRLRAVPPNRRDIGMVFQSYALWPHLSVFDNVMYPLRRRRGGGAGAERQAMQALETVRCQALADRFPGELSGGQQQRVALARALVAQPKLLLFDEPLSNLDAGLRRGLRDELARLHRDIGFTGLYVTHDQSEALSLGTDLAVMDHGRIVQTGSPAQIYERPATEFVARFFGANAVPGRVLQRDGQAGSIETPMGVVESQRVPCDGAVTLCFMPQAAQVVQDVTGHLQVQSALYLGSHREFRLAGAGCDIMVMAPIEAAVPPPHARVALRMAPRDVHVFPARGRPEPATSPPVLESAAHG